MALVELSKQRWLRSRFLLRALLFVAFLECFSLPAPELGSDETRWDNDGYVVSAESIASLTNENVDWVSGTGWAPAVRPKLVGGTAIVARQQGLRHLPEIMKLLDRRDSFVVAHVLLTNLWRVPTSKVPQNSKWIVSGNIVTHSVDYNGLNARVHQIDLQKDTKKIVRIPDIEQQSKAIREFWIKRLHDYPLEFSTKTLVND